jgi:chorismate mutase
MNNLELLRHQIDQLDNKLVDIIAERITVVQKIGEEKMKNGKATIDPERKNIVLEKWLARAKEKGLSPDFVKKIYATIHEYAVEVQNKNRE